MKRLLPILMLTAITFPRYSFVTVGHMKDGVLGFDSHLIEIEPGRWEMIMKPLKSYRQALDSFKTAKTIFFFGEDDRFTVGFEVLAEGHTAYLTSTTVDLGDYVRPTVDLSATE